MTISALNIAHTIPVWRERDSDFFFFFFFGYVGGLFKGFLGFGVWAGCPGRCWCIFFNFFFFFFFFAYVGAFYTAFLPLGVEDRCRGPSSSRSSVSKGEGRGNFFFD